MRPYPYPKSILVVDNCAIHRKGDLIRVIQGFGARMAFLPPYTPQYNPIECMFSKYKQWFKSNPGLLSEQSAGESIRMAIESVTSEDCQGWIEMVPFYVARR
jgi:transposase